jgi:hypothetical protein
VIWQASVQHLQLDLILLVLPACQLPIKTSSVTPILRLALFEKRLMHSIPDKHERLNRPAVVGVVVLIWPSDVDCADDNVDRLRSVHVAGYVQRVIICNVYIENAHKYARIISKA